MRKLLLVGAGGFGRVVLEHASAEYDCAFLDDGVPVSTFVDGVPVIGKSSDMERLFGEYDLLLVTIGNNQLRAKLYTEAARIGYDFPNIIVKSAYISPHAEIGKGCVILNNVVVQNDTRIGNGVILNPGVEAHHSCIIDDYCLIYTNSVVRALTHVHERARIGSTVTISTRAEVAADADIADGSVVGKDKNTI